MTKELIILEAPEGKAMDVGVKGVVYSKSG